MRLISSVLATGIGLATEYNASRKASKSPSRPVSDAPPKYEDYDSDRSTDLDEENWELDDVQRETAPDALSGEDGRDVDEVLEAFFHRHPPPQYREVGRLPCPVILPQRRPQTSTRGFVRAYAPVLQDCHIDQATWMDFLNGFHKAIKMSPYFQATNAAIAAGAIALQTVGKASITVNLATLAIHTSVEASRRGYTRYQTNKYIDTMNEKLFKPRGLYTMIMTYKPESTSADEVVDLNQNITKAVYARYDGHGSKLSQSSGRTYGELQLPQAAPLIFPELDALPEGEKESVFKRSGHFLGDYFDRRAQAQFEAENPDSKLNVAPRKEFASCFSDPNHPVHNGGLLTLATGGAVPGRGSRRAARRNPAQYDAGGQKTSAGSGQRTSLLGSLKKQLKENVLYLMVVNLPSEEEMREATLALGAEQ